MNIRIPQAAHPRPPIESLAAAPGQIRDQLDHLVHALCETLLPNLVGIYLHGSLAMGCFHPETSDIDLLVITEEAPDDTARRALFAALLASSGRPRPIEISFVHYTQVNPWHHPAPFDLHFSEMHRAATVALLAGLAPTGASGSVDVDLAAHFTVLVHRGLCLHGKAIDELGIDVPWPDYLDALHNDMLWAKEDENGSTVYKVLNACRCWAAVEERRVLSKAEGGRWASARAPRRHRGIIKAAVAHYAGADCDLKASEADDFCAWVQTYLGW